MIDKAQRRATAYRNDAIVVIHMNGGPDCLWMNMYLDLDAWQMTCDSDIGSYSYRWMRNACEEGFIEFCIKWLSNEEWLLRKCIGERHVSTEFDAEKSMRNLRELFAEENEDNANEDNANDFFTSPIYSDFNDMLEETIGYSDNVKEWCVAVNLLADKYGVCLPDEWYECVVCDYSPWQKRFAEICREVIVPALMQLPEPPKEDEKDENA